MAFPSSSTAAGAVPAFRAASRSFCLRNSSRDNFPGPASQIRGVELPPGQLCVPVPEAMMARVKDRLTKPETHGHQIPSRVPVTTRPDRDPPLSFAARWPPTLGFCPPTYWMLLRPSCRISRGFYAFLTLARVCTSFVRTYRKAHRQLGVPSLFLPSKRRDKDDYSDAILEVHAVAPPNPRSWFMGEQVIEGLLEVQVSSSDAETQRRWKAAVDDSS